MSSSVLCETCEMHDMPAAKRPQRLRGLKEAVLTGRTTTLQFLRQTVVFIVIEGDTCIALHAVTKVDTETSPQSAGIAIRAVLRVGMAIAQDRNDEEMNYC